MRVALTLAVLIFGSSASAQVDPLAPLADAPRPPIVRQAAQPVAASSSNSSLKGFAAYKQRLSGLARSAGVREATSQSVLPYLSLNASAIRLDRAQPGQISNPNATPPFAPLSLIHI